MLAGLLLTISSWLGKMWIYWGKFSWSFICWCLSSKCKSTRHLNLFYLSSLLHYNFENQMIILLLNATLLHWWFCRACILTTHFLVWSKSAAIVTHIWTKCLVLLVFSGLVSTILYFQHCIWIILICVRIYTSFQKLDAGRINISLCFSTGEWPLGNAFICMHDNVINVILNAELN